MNVIKRDGRVKQYDIDRIKMAIEKAFHDVYGLENYIDEITNLTREVDFKLNRNKDYTVEEIQDIVIQTLFDNKFDDVANSYKAYREKRSEERGNLIDKEIEDLIFGKSEYWKNENSNKNSTLVTTQRDYLAGIVSTDITKRKILPKDIVQAHNEGILHYHDMDYSLQNITNCDLINLYDMLQNGTVINGKMIEKPHRFLTAMTIATQIITAVTSSTYGGATITLTHLAPFVKSSRDKFYDKYKRRGLTEEQCNTFANEDLEKEIEDGVQTFNYQINSMSNTNGQSPFLTVFIYLGENNSEYAKEISMIAKEFFKQRLLGIKNEKGVYITQAFPKLIYVLEEQNIKEDSEYYWLTRLACKCTAKRFVPDYISEKKMKQLKNGQCFPNMSCRSFLTPWKDENGNYKFYGRFNQGVVTLSLPDVALSSKGNMEKFWKLMEERTELCHKALLVRHNRLIGTKSDVAPILWQYGAFARLKKGESIDKLLVSGYSSISLGYAGLYECVKYMTGESHIGTVKGKQFGLEVMKFLNKKCDQWIKEDNLGYGLYGSPIESTTYKFAKCLKKRFGIIEGITDRNYITNSYHCPVFQKIDAFEKLKEESEFQELSLGGAISYVECGNLTNNIDAVLEVVKYIYDNIMYAELNIKSDYCMECGFDGEMKLNDNLEWYCPNCGNRNHDTMNVTRRTCGYVGTNFWNKGRTQEINERYVHLDDKDIEEL